MDQEEQKDQRGVEPAESEDLMKNEEIKDAVEATKQLLGMFAGAQKAIDALAYLEQVPALIKARENEMNKLRNQIQGLIGRREQLTADVAKEEREAKEAIAAHRADIDRAKKQMDEELAKAREGHTAARAALKAEQDDAKKAHEDVLAGLKAKIKAVKKSAAV